MVKESRYILGTTLLCCIFQLMLVSPYYTTRIFFMLLISGGILIINNPKAYLHSKPTTIIAVLLYSVVLLLSPYKHISTIVLWLSLIYCSLFIQKVEMIGEPDCFERILWCLVFLICFVLIFWGEKNYGGMVFNNGDSNYSGVTTFLFIIFAEKRKLFGNKVLLAVMLLFGTKSRGFLLLTAVFYLCKLLKRMKLHLPTLDRKKVFLLFVIGAAATLVFSYVWVNVISSGHVAAYRTSLNDVSNRMRFSANLYAWEEELTHLDFTMLFTGYGGSLKTVMGIPNNENLIYNGVRLVQPHNMVFNVLVSFGWIPGLAFYWMLSNVVSRYFRPENYEYIFPFLLDGMTLQLNKPGYIILWLMVLALPNHQVYEDKRHITLSAQ